MRKRRIIRLLALILLVSTYFMVSSLSAYGLLLKKGSRGNNVVKLQNNLKQLGYFNARATGYYGSITEKSVKNFQKSHNLLVDGIAGNNTISLLNSKLEPVNASVTPLKKGMRSSSVVELQQGLKKTGYYSSLITGYYESVTESAVKKLQADYGLPADGIAGRNTLALLDKLLNGAVTKASSRAGVSRQNNYMANWFGSVANIFSRGTVATVYDIKSGLSFKAKRTYGENHADCEPLTANDTAIMKKIYGGKWSWSRKAVVVEVNGMKFAASINGMPHAGLDKYPAGKYVSNRSGGFGAGLNFDQVKGNNFNGHFCIHFYHSKTHGTNRIDQKHQAMIRTANEWIKRNN